MPKQGTREKRPMARTAREGEVPLFSMKKKLRQQEFGFVNWGGKRRGAGRKPKGERAGVSHAKRPRLPRRFPVLVTMKMCAGLGTLPARDVNELIRSAIAAGWREDFRVVEYSLQQDHIHALVEANDERSLSRGMNGLATRIARGLNRLWERVGRVFLERYHALQLTTPRAVRNALIYTLQNARKHGAWRGIAPDVFSSAPFFDGGTARSERVPIRGPGSSSGRGRGCSPSAGGGTG